MSLLPFYPLTLGLGSHLANAQTASGCAMTIPAGAISNGEALALRAMKAEKAAEKIGGGDPALMAFDRITDDIDSAAAFYNRVGSAPAVQEDETLQMIDHQVFFGEAIACRGHGCHIVFIRPVAQIAHHWLARIQRDFEKLESLGSKTPEGAKFISDLENANEKEQGSVWRHLSKLYCDSDSNGKYLDLNGSGVLCHNLLLPKGASTSPKHKGKS